MIAINEFVHELIEKLKNEPSNNWEMLLLSEIMQYMVMMEERRADSLYNQLSQRMIVM